jgi:hypothetical protein
MDSTVCGSVLVEPNAHATVLHICQPRDKLASVDEGTNF